MGGPWLGAEPPQGAAHLAGWVAGGSKVVASCDPSLGEAGLKGLLISSLPPAPTQDLPGRRAHQGPEEAQPPEGHVPEDDRGGPRGPDRGGESPAGRDQAAVHAVEGDHQLHGHPRVQDRGHQGEAARPPSSQGGGMGARAALRTLEGYKLLPSQAQVGAARSRDRRLEKLAYFSGMGGGVAMQGVGALEQLWLLVLPAVGPLPGTLPLAQTMLGTGNPPRSQLAGCQEGDLAHSVCGPKTGDWPCEAGRGGSMRLPSPSWPGPPPRPGKHSSLHRQTPLLRLHRGRPNFRATSFCLLSSSAS